MPGASESESRTGVRRSRENLCPRSAYGQRALTC